MTPQSDIPQRDGTREERGAPGEFDLSAIAARAAEGRSIRPWPSDDLGFLGAVLERHEVPPALRRRLIDRAGAEPATAPLVERMASALGQEIHVTPLGELLRRVPVRAGDVFYLPAGTLHAIGAGNLIFEIQQNSDTTYRVFDWNRLDVSGKPRQLAAGRSGSLLGNDETER